MDYIERINAIIEATFNYVYACGPVTVQGIESEVRRQTSLGHIGLSPMEDALETLTEWGLIEEEDGAYYPGKARRPETCPQVERLHFFVCRERGRRQWLVMSKDSLPADGSPFKGCRLGKGGFGGIAQFANPIQDLLDGYDPSFLPVSHADVRSRWNVNPITGNLLED